MPKRARESTSAAAAANPASPPKKAKNAPPTRRRAPRDGVPLSDDVAALIRRALGCRSPKKSPPSSCARRWASCSYDPRAQVTGSADTAARAVGVPVRLCEQCDAAQHVQVQSIVDAHELWVHATWSARSQSVWHGCLLKQGAYEGHAFGSRGGRSGDFAHTRDEGRGAKSFRCDVRVVASVLSEA